MIIASIRNFPRFAAGQQAGHWDPAVSDLIAGKRVLIVGYGSIGEAVERRLAGWEVAIDRVARHARDGVHPIGELPQTAAGPPTWSSSSSRSPTRPGSWSTPSS